MTHAYAAEPLLESGLGHQIVHTRVVGNSDRAGLARVLVKIPWIEEPVAAQVAVLATGNGSGTFFIPREGDEVLVLVGASPEQPVYVIGSLWTERDVPPRRDTRAASTIQLIRTPGGHEIELDDDEQSVTLTTKNKQSVRLTQQGIELRSKDGDGAASLQLTAQGDIIIKGQSLMIEVKKTLDLVADSIGIDADGACSLHGSTIHLNDP